MANASAKRIASQNTSAIKFLQIGLFLCTLSSFIIRVIFRIHSLSTASLSFYLHVISHIPSIVFTQYLIRIGTPKHDENGVLISAGEDLSRPGIIEWCYDIVYITWAAQITSAIFGEMAWWLFAAIPLYGGWKIYTTFVSSPLGKPPSSDLADDTASSTGATSKRQEKLRKRSERGDARVRSQAVKR